MAMEWPDLVRAIREEPESDGPRLVAADWLSDRGDPRGEYIVVACRLEAAASIAEYNALQTRRADTDSVRADEPGRGIESE